MPEKMYFLLLSVTLCLTLLLDPLNGEFILNSPVITNYGEWDGWKNCDNQTFVRKMTLVYDSIEENRPPPNDDIPDEDDNRGLIQIKFECASPYASLETPGNQIISPESTNSPSVDTPAVECEGYAIGFQLLSDEPQIALDNTGANNIRLYCSGLKDSATQYIEGYGEYTGEWSDPQYCKDRQAICGIQSQVQKTAGKDDSGLNNVRIRCCDIPSPASNCTPTDRWEMVQECDNLNGTNSIQCTFYRTVGLGTNINFEPENGKTLLEQYYENAALGFGISSGYSETPFWLMYDLSNTFKKGLGVSNVTGHDWGAAVNEVWNVESSTIIHFEVKEGYRAEISQLVGSCSHYSVKTPRLKKVDKTRYQSKEIIDQYW